MFVKKKIERCGSVNTPSRALALDDDLALLSLGHAVNRTRNDWFSHMRRQTYEQWTKTASTALAFTAEGKEQKITRAKL